MGGASVDREFQPHLCTGARGAAPLAASDCATLQDDGQSDMKILVERTLRDRSTNISKRWLAVGSTRENERTLLFSRDLHSLSSTF